MAVHNGVNYLGQAMDSILGQSFTDFEFLIIDDASSDGSQDLVRRYRDPRIRLIHNKRQVGLTRSLIAGWEASEAKYIARMDHDDVSFPGRFAAQVDFLETHPEVDVLGTSARTLGNTPEQTWRYPARDEEIRCEFVFNSAIVHSSVMLRRDTFDRHGLCYDPEVERAQDYEFWTRASPFVRFANLSKILVFYRIHPEQIGTMKARDQQAMADNIRLRQLAKLGIEPNDHERELHNSIAKSQFLDSSVEFAEVENWFLKLIQANNKTNYLPKVEFGKSLERRWWAVCRSNAAAGLAAWRAYIESPISRLGPRAPAHKIRFFVKCLVTELVESNL